jgi:hypothetical protein
MFLDEKIVNLVIEQQEKNIPVLNTINDVIALCNEKVSNNIKENMLDSDLVQNVKQVCNLWDSAAKTLEKKGYSFLKIGGYRTYQLSHPDIAEILVPMGF